MPTLEDIQNACAVPLKGARAYARVKLEANLELAFIRTNGRRNEPLEAWYITTQTDNLRIDESQALTLLALRTDDEILTLRQ